MSADKKKRRKRANKANRTSVRSLQARQESHDLQAENKSMPQSESEEVAETDRTKTINKEVKTMRHVSIADRIKEHKTTIIQVVKEHKTTIIQVVVVVAIAVVVSAIMTPMLAPSKGTYDTDMAALQSDMVRIGAHINTLGTDLTDQITALKKDTETAGTTTATNSHDIDTLQAWVDGAEARITTVEAQNSPLEGYLTGNFNGSYTLHAKCDTAGNYTANVNLVYLTPVSMGNTTQEDALQAFYGSINWTGIVPNYVCTTTYSGNTTTWGISKVWWNIGIFNMTVGNEALVNIAPVGLNSTYDPDFAYVEVWPVLK